MIHDSVLVEIPAKTEIVKWFGINMNQWMIDVPVELFNCPVPFKTDFEIGINWGDLGGTEFDYNTNNPNEYICIEDKDDNVIKSSFDSWYKEVTQK